jgi:hypothetical protein
LLAEDGRDPTCGNRRTEIRWSWVAFARFCAEGVVAVIVGAVLLTACGGGGTTEESATSPGQAEATAATNPSSAEPTAATSPATAVSATRVTAELTEFSIELSQQKFAPGAVRVRGRGAGPSPASPLHRETGRRQHLDVGYRSGRGQPGAERRAPVILKLTWCRRVTARGRDGGRRPTAGHVRRSHRRRDQHRAGWC